MADGGSVRNNVIAIIQAVDLEYGATLFVDYLADPRFRDTALAVDEFDRQVDFIRTVSDAASAVDAASMAPDKGFADQVTATDGSSMAFAPGVIADSVTVDDAVILQVAFNLTFADIVTVADDFQFILATIYNLNFADGVVAADAATTAVDKVLADIATPADAFSRVVAFVRSVAETATTSDGVSMSGGSIQSATFSDDVVVDDAVSLPLTVQVSFADAVTASDLFATDRTIPVSFADAVTTSDLATPGLTKPVSFADAVTTSDLATPGLTKPVSFADAVTASDLFSTAANMTRSLSDGMTATDVVAPALTKVVSFAENVSMADGMARETMWDNVELLLQGGGPFGGNNLTFLDSSPYNKPISIGAQLPFQGSVTPYVGGGGSAYFGAGGSAYFGATGSDYLTTPQSDHFHFPAGTNFTIELWFMCVANSPPDYNNDLTGMMLGTATAAGLSQAWTLLVQGGGGPSGPTGAGAVYMEMISGNGTYQVVVAPPPAGGWTQNVWHHVAVCRVGTVTTIYVDGVNRNSYTLADQDIAASGPMVIGKSFSTGVNRIFKGYLADIRISKGVAYYTANFTPPTARVAGNTSDVVLKLEFVNAAVWDSARKNDVHLDGLGLQGTLWGGNSFYFDGNNRNIQTEFLYPLPDRMAPMVEDFTVETWFWMAGNSPVQTPSNLRNSALIGLWPNGGATAGWLIYIIGDGTNTGTGLAVNWNSNESMAYFGTIPKNSWHHVALSRLGATVYLHFDGVMVQSFNPVNKIVPPSALPYQNPLLVGMTPYPGWPMPYFGYMEDIRYTIGKARYGSGNIILPGAPLPKGTQKYARRIVSQPSENVTPTDTPTLTRIGGVSFIGGFVAAAGLPAFSNMTLPAGSLAGDLWCVVSNRDLITVSGGATYVTSVGSPATRLGYKLLTAGDITAGYVRVDGAYTHTSLTSLVFRGATSFAIGSQVTSPGSAAGVRSVTTPAFTPNVAANALLACYYYDDTNTVFGTVPAGWTLGNKSIANLGEWANFYRLDVTGVAVTFDCTAPADAEKHAVIFEIR